MVLLSKKVASVLRKSCVSCATCTKYCPKDAITIFKGCFAQVNIHKCIGCGRCAKVCPTNCIILKARDDNEI